MEQCTVVDHHHHDHCSDRRVCCGAIIGGALVGIGLAFLLNLFSIAIGLSAFTTSPEGLTILTWGGIIGLIIGSFVSMFVMGHVAGYIGTNPAGSEWYGIFHGFAAWVLALIVTILLTASAAQYMTSYNNFLAKPVIATANTVTAEAKPVVNVPTSTAEAQANPQQTTTEMGKVAWVGFVLFFVGAFAASLGGLCGFGCRRKAAEVNV